LKRHRGIFTKLVLIFLLIGLLPFLVVSLVTYHKARDGMTEAVIQYWLVRQARETAARLDQEVQDAKALIRSWADDDALEASLKEVAANGETAELVDFLTSFLERRRKYRSDLDLLLLVDQSGRVLAESLRPFPGGNAQPRPLRELRISELPSHEPDQNWISLALSPGASALGQPEAPISTKDWHVSPLVRYARRLPPWDGANLGYPKSPEAYAIGFGGTIRSDNRDRAVGALVAVFNWSRIQGVLDEVTRRFKEPDVPGASSTRYPSGYPFLFARDLDTVIGHEHRENLGTSLSKDHQLPGFREVMGQDRYGSFFYEYRSGEKISGYAHTADVLDEGFGWVVGVGINSPEIYRDVKTLRDFVIVAGLLVTGMVLLLAAMFSHRITEPIRALIGYTQELSKGRLDARVHINTRDEIAVLADSFNRMAQDLQESNRRLIEAEKNAAWSEMARQVAHEIKNPLTPIMLSAQQIKRAHEDRHPDFDSLLSESVRTIVEQCEDLKKIASDFSSFSRFNEAQQTNEPVKPLLRRALDLYQSSASSRIRVVEHLHLSDTVCVRLNPDRFHRLLLNLINNAMEAMGEAGTLTITAREMAQTKTLVLHIEDTGRGIPPEAAARLFEPYFSTRTGGTGLGLAISKRIVEESGGTIRFEARHPTGTAFIIDLPISADSP
jgi:signal transduction histidine kinase